MAPNKVGLTPSKADALPAIWPCLSIANVKDAELMIPVDPTNKKRAITRAYKGL